MNIYSEQKYCVYLTSYKGNKLPPFYIGSSTIDRINNKNYHGSVKSRQYYSIWTTELQTNPHLFKTVIISLHTEREEALQKEYKLQKVLNVVESSLYINMSFASPKGYFGKTFYGKEHKNYLFDDTQPKYIFVSPFNEIIVNQGMKSICVKYNLNRNKFVRILNHPTTCKSHKGWRIFNYSDEKLKWLQENKEFIVKTCQTIIAINKNKEIFLLTTTLQKFCKKHNIHSGTAYECLYGKYLQVSGWRFFKYEESLYKNIQENINDFIVSSKPMPTIIYKTYYFVSPENENIKITNLKKFCDTNDLSYECMLKVNNGRTKTHNGWKRSL